MLEVKNVTKKFNNFKAIDNLSFSLSKGDMFGFLGKNGAGKSTTFRMILGIIEPTNGEIIFSDEKKMRMDNIGFLPEERGLHTQITVEKELVYMASLKGMSHKAAKKEINYWLEKFEILQNKKKKISSLSKGNQQKIQLIASLIHNPELLILDEPFSGLDPVNVELLKSAIKEMNKNGTTIIFSSHRLEHIEVLCNKIGIIDKGRMVKYGKVNEVKSKMGYKKVIIESEEDFSYLANINGIDQVGIKGNLYTFQVDNESTYQLIFNEIRKKKSVTQFRIVNPSINDVFIDAVRGGKEIYE